jgi:hypothetical protein
MYQLKYKRGYIRLYISNITLIYEYMLIIFVTIR